MPQTDSPVVQFVSKGQDADGLHTLIADNEFGAYRLPPMATVTIEAVYPPGEGEAYGIKAKSRFFVVSLSYRTGNMWQHADTAVTGRVGEPRRRRPRRCRRRLRRWKTGAREGRASRQQGPVTLTTIGNAPLARVGRR